MKQAVRTLTASAEELDELTPTLHETSPKQGKKVFVVHGHDEGAREAVARFLERLELEAVILMEQPDRGMTVIEKFEAHASEVSFAVVLLTPDDLGGSVANGPHRERARQNVVFELGYFVGKLGRGRACLLRKGAIEMPSDLAGVIYSELDPADGWKLKLVRELKAAGFTVDANSAARRIGLSESAFLQHEPRLRQYGFPFPDPVTGNYDLVAIDAWLDRRSGLSQQALRAIDAADGFEQRLAQIG